MKEYNRQYYLKNLEKERERQRQYRLNNPEKFSPNVIMRPLYQEVILPNLCYIGGGGELAYWLELKSYFEASNVTFPILLLRNSVLLATEKQAKKADKLGLSWKDLFSKQEALMNNKVKTFSEFSIDFTSQKAFLRKQFDDLNVMANATDKSFIGAVKAQEAKQIKGLENLEKRLLKAEKKKQVAQMQRQQQSVSAPSASKASRQAWPGSSSAAVYSPRPTSGWRRRDCASSARKRSSCAPPCSAPSARAIQPPAWWRTPNCFNSTRR